MRRYECIIILDPELSEEQRLPVLDRVKEMIPQQEGLLVEIDEWGSRKLSYEIKKKERGYYIRFDFCGATGLVDEMERFFRIADGVLKYMTVLIDEEPDMERVQEEIAQAEIKAAQAKETQEGLAAQTEPENLESGKSAPKEAIQGAQEASEAEAASETVASEIKTPPAESQEEVK